VCIINTPDPPKPIKIPDPPPPPAPADEGALANQLAPQRRISPAAQRGVSSLRRDLTIPLLGPGGRGINLPQ
jgi:hypothetical protein